MDDEITRREVVYLGNELVEVTPTARDPRQTVAEDVLLAEEHVFAGCETLLNRQNRESNRVERQLCEGIAIGDAPQVGNTAFAQDAQEALGRAFAERRDCRLSAGFALVIKIIAH